MSENTIGQNYSRFKRYYLDIRRISGRSSVQKSLTLALSFFLIAFFIAFALRPTLTKITELKVKIDESEETLSKLEQKSAALVRASSVLDEVADFVPSLRASVPISPFYRTYVKEVESLAIRHNLTYLTSSFDPALILSVVDPYLLDLDLEGIPLPYNFRLSGDYVSIRSFLNDFRNIDRVAEIEQMSIVHDVQPGSESEQGLVLNVNGSVYYFGDSSEIIKILGDKKKK